MLSVYTCMRMKNRKIEVKNTSQQLQKLLVNNGVWKVDYTNITLLGHKVHTFYFKSYFYKTKEYINLFWFNTFYPSQLTLDELELIFFM